MNRKTQLKAQRRASLATVADAPANRDQAATTGPFLLLGGGGFQAAGQDPARGYIYWPSTDTRRQITAWTRHEVARKIQFLYNHFGFIRRLESGLLGGFFRSFLSFRFRLLGRCVHRNIFFRFTVIVFR